MAMADDQRRTINCRVSEQSYTMWRSMCTEHGVSMTALLEAIPPALAERADPDTLHDLKVEIVEQARRIDQQRRRRST